MVLLNIRSIQPASYFHVDADLDSDIFALKQKIIELFPNYEINGMRLIIRGTAVDDHTMLKDTTVLYDPCIHLIYRA
jgi:hypothetical protein